METTPESSFPGLPEPTSDELARLSFDEIWEMMPTRFQMFLSQYAEQRFTKAHQAYLDTIYDKSKGEVHMASVYSSASRLLKNPLIAAALRQIGETARLSIISATAHLSALATASIEDFVDVVPVIESYTDEATGELRERQARDANGEFKFTWQLNLPRAIKEGRAYGIDGVKQGRNGLEVKLADRLGALRTLTQFHQPGAAGTVEDPIHHVHATTPSNFQALVEERLAKAAEHARTFSQHAPGGSPDGEDET